MRFPNRAGIIVAACLFAVAVPSASSALERPVTLEEAVKAALEHSPKSRMSQLAVEKARDIRNGSLGPMFPNVTIDAGLQYWDDATGMDFLGGDMPSDDELAAAVEPFAALIPEESKATFGKLMNGLSKMRNYQVADQLTASVTIQAVQPLTPLISLAAAWRAYGAAEDAARLEAVAERNNITYEVSQVFFQLMSAIRMTEVARQGVELVQAHLKMAQSFQKADMVGRDDVLRAETALAQISAQYDQGRHGVELARAALNVMMGIPPDEETVPAGDFPDEPPELTITEEDAVERALAARPEQSKLQAQVRMAEAGKAARVGQLVPVIAAVFRYTWFHGSEFQRENSAFIGAVLQWDFWNMGQRWFEMKAADKDLQMARAGMDMARDLITLDVRKAFIDLKTGRSLIASYRKAVESAEENLRVVTKKYEAASATSVEMLDAHTSLNMARANLAVAVNNYYISYANLQRALAGSL
ncbi:MAG TPA: TolC family protein [Myxococcota bacterium]|nr:TolC family protein [Myxococcota bacterium]